MQKVVETIFLKLMLSVLKNYMNFIMIFHFYQKEWKLKKSKSLQLIYVIKLKYHTHNKFKTGIKLWISFEKRS